ncbi:C-signal [Pseudohyphozyma bogoriensis]|nr:C-signal [Pseudohyphozyma bogoriensis]
MRSFNHFRLNYNLSHPFSATTTFLLVASYILAMLGLLVFNFLTQARRPVCIQQVMPNYDPDTCEPSPLAFFSQYFTRPQTELGVGTIGTFPWTTNGFSINSNGPIDYSVLALNWTSNPLECAMYEQSFVLHLDTQASTTYTCFYCGPNLRILCSVVDSERTSIPISPQLSYQKLLSEYDYLGFLARKVVTTALTNATVTAIRMDRHQNIPAVQAGVLPFNDTTINVALGTTLGFLPIEDDDPNPDIAIISQTSKNLSSFIEQITSQDLQPDVRNATNLRTLSADYLCTSCSKQYKAPLEIIAILIGATFGVLSPLFAIAKFFAEQVAPNAKDDEDLVGGPQYQAANSGTGYAMPVMNQQQSYGSGGGSPGWKNGLYVRPSRLTSALELDESEQPWDANRTSKRFAHSNKPAGIAEIEALDIAKNGIDVLINNAGIMTGSSGSFSWAPATACPTSNLEEILKVNLFGAMNLTLATLPLLRRGRDKKIFTTSSLLASMGGPITQSEAMGAGAAHYAVSKAAVNMYFVKLAKELAAEQFTVVLYDPGYVKTDMNGGLAGSAEIYKEESVEKTLKNIILTKGPADSGKFFNSTAENPW